uniref:Major facilitator superfamily (MFS) profile domain-containing protein n=1 Tax=Paramoeba aestuarina TaxID=180227 RepID=A0A7S4PCI1_9EUKA|mmetsp:Transcript_40100/g.63425  ORF Transcript_40100/g.63425 Transcript_40100/m.63425 type:complete len:600 (+) Transcript_40100:132-1931(+)
MCQVTTRDEGEREGSDIKLASSPSTLLYLEEVLEHIGLTKLHVIVLVSCALGYYAVCVEMMMFIFMYYPLVETWNISGLDYALYQALGTACSFVAGLSCGWWADRFGRRGPLLFGIGIAWAAGFASAFSSSFWMYVGFRCAVSAGLAAVSVVNFVIVSEFFPPAHRDRSLVVVSTCGTLGVLSCAGVAWILFGAYSSDDWRLFVVLVSIPLLLSGILHFLFVPRETAKYLMLQERWDDVFHVLCAFAASGRAFQPKDESSTLLPPLSPCSVCGRQTALFYSSPTSLSSLPSLSSLSLGEENEYQIHPSGIPFRNWVLQTKENNFFCHCGLAEGFRKTYALDEGRSSYNNNNSKFINVEDRDVDKEESFRDEESIQLVSNGSGTTYYMAEEMEKKEGEEGEETCWGDGLRLFRGDKLPITVALSFLWLLQAMAYWGFCSFLPKFYAEIGLNLYPQMALMVGMELPAYALGLFLVKREYLGVVNCLCLYFGLTFISLLILGLGAYVESKGLEVVFSTTSFMFLVPNYAFLYSFSPAQYPTSLRSTAMGFFNGVAAFPGLFTPFVGFALTSLPSSETYVYPLAWSVCVFAAFCLSFLLKYLK